MSKKSKLFKEARTQQVWNSLSFWSNTFFPYFAQRKRLGTLTISAVTPTASYFTVHIEGITVKTSWFLKTSPKDEITGNVLDIFVQWHMHNCANMSNLNRRRAKKMNVSVFLNMWGLENRFQMQNINCRLKSPADFMASQSATKYFTLNAKKKARIICNNQWLLLIPTAVVLKCGDTWYHCSFPV